MAPIPHTSRGADLTTGTHDGARLNAEFDRLYADANSLLTQIENVLGLNGNVTSEVLAARKGQPNLLAEIDRLEAIKAEVEAARNSANQGGAFASLDARLEAIDSRITSALSAAQGAAEVVEARTDSAGKVHAAIRQAINNGSKDLEGLSLAAINRVVLASGAIVDAIIYDTSRDSDGGAWRERCSHLSWFNETLNTATRGKTAKFPAIALIVAEASRVTIYDATDPMLPMWMVFNTSGTNTSATAYMLGIFSGSSIALCALNGTIYAGSNAGGSEGSSGLAAISFPADMGVTYRHAAAGSNTFPRPIAGRNTQSVRQLSNLGTIVSALINDVSATILPGAPIDPATGLPVPTVVCGTGGGVSVIHSSGAVVNSATTAAIDKVHITASGDLLYGRNSDSGLYYARSIGSLSPGFALVYYNSNSVPAMHPGSGATSISATKAGLVRGNGLGLNILYDNPTEPTKAMVSYVTKDYFSGILHGDIRRAWLASGTAETLAGGDVQNGTFSDFTGWTSYTSAPSSAAAVGGVLKLDRDAAGGDPIVGTPYTIVAGKTYLVSFEITAINASSKNIGVGVGTASPSYPVSGGFSSPGKYSYLWTPSTSGAELRLYGGGAAPYSMSIDNLSVRMVDLDRSVKNKPISVYGSLVKSSVAVGADLMGYSGFSALNYLEEPYSADLDFGTGDFCVMGWLKENPNSANEFIFCRAAFSGSWTGGGVIYSYVSPSGTLVFVISDDNIVTADSITSSAIVDDGTWKFVTFARRGSSMEMWINGVRAASDVAIVNAAASLNNASATTRLGYRQDSQFPLTNGTLALWRFAAFAPSPEQIRAIYEAERHLFADNAKCLLGGTSNAVQALDYDPDTNQLLVGTANGVSVFQGLRRVNYISGSPLTSANMKAVSGVNGAILMAGGAEAVYQAPQRNIREEVERVKRRFVTQTPRTAWFTSAASQVDFDLPTRASRILGVTVAGALAREASGAATNRYQVLDYGYKQTIRLGSSPTTGSDVAVQYIEEV